MDQYLSLDDDLGQVIEELHDVSLKWYNIGLQLKVSNTCLEKIKREESDSSDKLLEMSKAWLKKLKPKPTWSALVKALNSRSVGEEKEASRLEEKYCSVPKLPSAATTRASEQQPKGTEHPMPSKQQPRVADTETALATSVQLQKSTKTATKRASTSTDTKMPTPKRSEVLQKYSSLNIPGVIMNLEVGCSNAEKGCSWKGKLEELEHHRQTCLKEEVACPYSEVGCEIRCLREELDDHQDQSQRYHLDLTLATIKTLKDELKQNNIRCKHAQFGCDWRGKSIEERDAHTAVCPKEQIQCPFDEEFQCRDVYFHREELNVHLQYHITSLHTQFQTCQYQSRPVTFTIPGFQSSLLNLDRCDNDIRTKEYKFPFYIRDRQSYMCIHQGAYLMRLCISVKSKNGIDVYVESMPGSYDHRLPRSGRAKIEGFMHSSSNQPDLKCRLVRFDFPDVTITPPTAGQSPVKCTGSIHYKISQFYTQLDKVSDSEYFITTLQ